MHPAGNSGSVLFFLAIRVESSQSCWFLYRHRQTDNYKRTQVQLCVLDWTVTRLEWLCQLCYVNYLCVEKHENSDPKLCGSLEDCFGPWAITNLLSTGIEGS